MEEAARTWKLLPLIETTARFFREKGLPSPRVDAELLMGHLLGKRRIDLYLEHDRHLTEQEVDRFREMVRDRASRRPVQRIVGATEFYGVTIAVPEGVFIPRPETELLVDRGVEFFRATGGGEGRTALDAGTGSGAIAVALAKNVPGLRIVAVDRSPAALAAAAENARRNGLEDRWETVEGDGAAEVRVRAGALDLVVSNPPYVTSAEMEALPPEVLEHDPAPALHGGADGLDAYRALVPAAAAALLPGGAIVLEVSDSTAEGVLELARAERRLEGASVTKDLAGHLRVFAATARHDSVPG
ncbi:MAG: peptide chain release factor N(5)-glutamine methyltransferase [Candidatus Eisenbacteria bacterium]